MCKMNCITLLQGVMEKLIQTCWTCPLSTAWHMNHIHTSLPYLKEDSSFGVLGQSLSTLQPCVVTALKLTVAVTLPQHLIPIKNTQ